MSKKIWELYPALTRAIKATHDQTIRETGDAMFYCHDMDHVIRVANMAMEIAEDETVGRLAAVAALCHNADRIIQKNRGLGPFGEVPYEDVVALVSEWLDTEGLKFERVVVIEAVLGHSEKNSPGDNAVLICLKDADRLINIGADCILRKAQYWGDKLPVVDPIHLLNNPGARFTAPGSILKALWFDAKDFMAEDGPAALRLPKARKIGAVRARFWQLFIDEVVGQREDEGLVPYPTFE